MGGYFELRACNTEIKETRKEIRVKIADKRLLISRLKEIDYEIKNDLIAYRASQKRFNLLKDKYIEQARANRGF